MSTSLPERGENSLHNIAHGLRQHVVAHDPEDERQDEEDDDDMEDELDDSGEYHGESRFDAVGIRRRHSPRMKAVADKFLRLL
jgi:hypothetical protein